MIAAFYNLAVFQHHDGVGIANGGEAMGDDEGRAAFHQFIHTSSDEFFRMRIDGARGFIQNEDDRIGNGGARNG